jgi:hypothetical protein
MQTNPNIDDETLVAFLDGELPSEQQATIEQNLQSDDSLRQRVRILKASWDLLTDLPQPQPRRDLAESTIEIVTLALDQESRTWWEWMKQRPWLSLGLAGLVMLATGAATSRVVTGLVTRQILVNLPAIVAYRQLENIDSVEFLEQLSEIPNLIQAAGLEGGPTPIGNGIVPPTIGDRKTWVEELAEVDRGRLESNLLEYRISDEKRRQQLKSMTDRIYADPTTTAGFLETGRAYNAILDKLGNKQKARLRQMSIEQRLAEINERVDNEMVMNYALSGADRAAIRSWLDDLQFKEENFEILSFNPDPDSMIIRELLYMDADVSFVTRQDLEDLTQRLSPEAAELLANLEDESSLRRHLGLWVSTAVQATTQTGVPKVFDLEDKFQELSKDRQDELEWMPEDEVRKILRQIELTLPLATPLPSGSGQP